MAKDYAKGGYSTNPPKKRKVAKSSSSTRISSNKPTKFQRPSLLFGGFLFAGILVGLFIAGLAYISHHKTAAMAALTQPKAKPEEAITNVSKKKPALKKVATHPHYDFYTILPNKKVDTPKAHDDIEKAIHDEYILQVASVKKFQDADRLRAQLLLLGYEVFINKSQSGKLTWHRVNIGPFKTLHEAEQKQDNLRKNQINSMLLKRSKTT